MTQPPNDCRLANRDPFAPSPVLLAVQAEGRVDGPLFALTWRQTYRNDSDRVLEVVYTFPMPMDAVLLGFSSTLGGRCRQAVVVARQQAEQRYEAALEVGDAPVLLQALGGGLYSASIGNLAPGETIALEGRFAQVLRVDRDGVNVRIPATIAPRYGRPDPTAIEPQQVPGNSLVADFPLSLSLTIGAALSGASVASPTHPLSTGQTPDGELRVQLDPSARLDRDVVLRITPREPLPALLIRGHDASEAAAPVVMMALLHPPMPARRARIALKLLVDRSGSMAGEGIASARRAVLGALDSLGEGDCIGLSGFGSMVQHLFEPVPVRPQTMRHLRAAVPDLQADLGGTEIAQALQAVFRLPMPVAGEVEGSDVLLITDGQVWDVDATVAAARASGHRIFVIGVGLAPAEGLLRRLAEATGGFCEFAAPGEALEAAAQRMLERVRQQPMPPMQVDWGRPPVWFTASEGAAFGGEPFMAMAGFAAPIDPRAVCLTAADSRAGSVERVRVEADAPCPGDALARVAASRRLAQLEPARALALALQHQLLSDQTACVLVHERAQADRPTEASVLHRLQGMTPPSWVDTSAVLPPDPPAFFMPLPPEEMRGVDEFDQHVREIFDIASVARALRTPFAARAITHDLPKFRQTLSSAPSVESAPPGMPTLLDIALRVSQWVASGQDGDRLLDALPLTDQHPEVQRALAQAMGAGLSLVQAWVVLARWIGTRDADASRGQMHLGNQEPDAAIAAAATAGFEAILGSHSIDTWTLSLMEQIRRVFEGTS